jgi:two-component system, NarL family, sensor histidine kinase DesK
VSELAQRDQPPELGGFRRYTWWSLAGANAAVLTVLVGLWIADTDLSAWAVVACVLALGVTVVAVTVLFTRRLAAGSWAATDLGVDALPRVWAAAGAIAAVGLAGVMIGAGDDGLWSVAPALMASVVATYLPRSRRLPLIVAVGLAAAATGSVTAWTSDVDPLFGLLFPLGMVASIAWLVLGMLWAWDLAERLSRSRELAAELAVKDERLRFAADLHDIQGHHLQVIALKGELAARLTASDPARAIAEMKEVQRLATDALQDTRAVVQGYRRTTLADEISNAAKVLAAADIDTVMDLEPLGDELPEGSRHLLGLVMREATTNVLRHSQAGHAEVGYGIVDGVARLRVANDGAAPPPTVAPVEGGTGLAGLAERLVAAGGALTWTLDGERFVLTAALPIAGSREERR